MKYLGEHGDGKSVGTFAQGISGAVAGQYVRIQSVDENGVPTGYVGDAPPGGDVTADMLGIVIDGNSTPVGAAVGQYVIVKNSTISGITDGLYTAAQVIPANTAIDATYLTAVSGGGLNDLNQKIKSFIKSKTKSISTSAIYSGMSITANVSSGYKFLIWLPTGASSGWIASFPIYLASPRSKTSGVFYNGTIESGNNKYVDFAFLEILDL